MSVVTGIESTFLNELNLSSLNCNSVLIAYHIPPNSCPVSYERQAPWNDIVCHSETETGDKDPNFSLLGGWWYKS